MVGQTNLDINRAVELVKEKTDGRECPFCSHKHWLVESAPGNSTLKQLLGAGEPSPIFLITDNDSFWEGPPTVPAIALSCSNCGFIRLHNIAALLGDGENGE